MATTICTHPDHRTPGRCPGCGTYLSDLSSAELSATREINEEIVADIPLGEDEVTVYLDSPNGPKAHYLGSLDLAEVLAALPSGWTVHEDAWQSAVQIDDLTWSVPLTKVD